MNINLEELIITKYRNVLNDILEHLYTHYWFSGGRGSTKSSFIALIIIILLLQHSNVNVLVLRKIGSTLKESVFNQLLWAIDKLCLNEYFKVLTSPLLIIYKPTGQKIFFRGADKPLKIKSIKPDIGYIGVTFFEEVDQFNGEEEIRSILQSTNRGGSRFWNFYAFNPPKSRDNWANIAVTEHRTDKIVIKNSYLDVPVSWLGEQFILEANILKEKKPQTYEHEYLGIATGNGGSVFENVQGVTLSEEDIKQMEYFYYGCDFGYAVDPFVWIRLSYNSNTKTLYILDEIFSVKLSIQKTIELIKAKQAKLKNMTIKADASSPQIINEFNKNGILTKGAKRGIDVIDRGLKWLQDLDNIIIDQVNAPNALREFSNYEYAMDKFGNFISEYPDKNNHTIDAVRYAMESVISTKVLQWS